MGRDQALLEIRGGDAWARCRAAEALSSCSDGEARAALVTALADGVAEVREAAANGLTQRPDASVVPLVLPLIRSDAPGTRNAALRVLEPLATTALPALLDLSREADPRMRIFAANLLGAATLDAAHRLVALLKDPDLNVQDAAVAALGRLRSLEAVPLLASRLKGGDPWLRFSAVDALSRIGGVEALRALQQALKGAEKEFLAALSDAIGAAALSAAIEALGGEGPGDERVLALSAAGIAAEAALRAAGGASWERLLARSVAEDLARLELDAPLRATALTFLQLLGAPEAETAARASLQSPDAVVRKRAADILATGGKP